MTLVGTNARTISEAAMRLGRRLSSGIAEDPPVTGETTVTAPPAEAPAPAPAEARPETREHAPAQLAEH